MTTLDGAFASAITGPEIIADEPAIDALASSWHELVVQTGAAPFASPDWLLPWRTHYAAGSQTFLLAWRDAGGVLVGVVPIVIRRRRLPPLRELGLWGGQGPALRGLVDVVARPAHREAVTLSLARWLSSRAAGWDTLSLLRLPSASPTVGAVRGLATRHGWRVASLTGVVRSESYVLDLRAPDGSPVAILGPKARHNLRTEARRFERSGGRYEPVSTAEAVPGLVAAIRKLSMARWGAGERTFRADPAAEPFLVAALQAMAGRGSFQAHVARDASGIRAGVVALVVGRRAVALIIGVSTGEDVRRVSPGKHLFAASIDAAMARGADTYDFLWVGGYKESFWGATPRRLESLVAGRGPLGRLMVRRAAARRRPGPDRGDREDT